MSTDPGQERFRYRAFSIYAWGFPLVINCAALTLDLLPVDAELGKGLLRPRFGERRCWFYGEYPNCSHSQMICITSTTFFCWLNIGASWHKTKNSNVLGALIMHRGKFFCSNKCPSAVRPCDSALCERAHTPNHFIWIFAAKASAYFPTRLQSGFELASEASRPVIFICIHICAHQYSHSRMNS